jgi:hypothetical protein
MGHPYLVCFKTCIATIAQQMDFGGFQPEDKFSVVMDKNELDIYAITAFYQMKDNPKFRHSHRLQDCIRGSAESFVGLQAADFIAYETFRLMQGKRVGIMQIRHALSTCSVQQDFSAINLATTCLSALRVMSTQWCVNRTGS